MKINIPQVDNPVIEKRRNTAFLLFENILDPSFTKLILLLRSLYWLFEIIIANSRYNICKSVIPSEKETALTYDTRL